MFSVYWREIEIAREMEMEMAREMEIAREMEMAREMKMGRETEMGSKMWRWRMSCRDEETEISETMEIDR